MWTRDHPIPLDGGNLAETRWETAKTDAFMNVFLRRPHFPAFETSERSTRVPSLRFRPCVWSGYFRYPYQPSHRTSRSLG